MHVFPLLHFIVLDIIHNPLSIFLCATYERLPAHKCMYVQRHVCNSVTSDVKGTGPRSEAIL